MSQRQFGLPSQYGPTAPTRPLGLNALPSRFFRVVRLSFKPASGTATHPVASHPGNVSTPLLSATCFKLRPDGYKGRFPTCKNPCYPDLIASLPFQSFDVVPESIQQRCICMSTVYSCPPAQSSRTEPAPSLSLAIFS